MEEIKSLKPEAIWHNFYALTQVPRPSGHLEKVQQFLLDFAKQVGVEAFKDPAGNIVMRKPATPGMENRKTVLLQGHMDMVPQKVPESTHHFETDPIDAYIDGDWVKAKGTTLGSDDGMGVATAMAVMESKDMKHGPVEVLITRDEETGMYGANDLPEGELHSDILLNLDSELWGKFTVGSAGGIDVNAELDYKEDTNHLDGAVKVTLKGLRGGHSGLEINEGRANANKEMVRLVRQAIAKEGARLVSWHGGSMRNAIPFQAVVILALPKKNISKIEQTVEQQKHILEDEFKGIESDVQFSVEEVAVPETCVPEEIQDNLVDAIFACHNGVLRMVPAFPNVVETSSNLAIIDIDDHKALFKILVRSSREDMKAYMVEQLTSCFSMAGMKTTTGGDYSGWDPVPGSPIVELVKKVYCEQNGENPVIQADHAGLECSVILSKYPGLDIVSFGPTILSPHTTNERCLMSSVIPYWNLVKEVLAEIPEK